MSVKYPLVDFTEYTSECHKRPSTEELQQILYDYYEYKFEEQEGILVTPHNDTNTYRNQKYRTKITSLEEYFKAHKVWKPQLSKYVFPNGQYRDPLKIQDKNKFDSFINYIHLPPTIGREPIPSLVHHTACSLNGFVYLLGGGRNFSREKDLHLINTDNIEIDYKKLPFPIDNNILNHPFLIPNSNLYSISTESSYITTVEVSGDVPPPLFCMSASAITQRHIFYYGGFQFIDKIEKINGKYIIKRDVELNNSGYILDVSTLKFKKFELIAHPTILQKSPVTVPRFGHISKSINIHKCLYDTDETIPATVFIMGGYKKTTDGNFETIGDLWKVEFSTTYKGKHDYLEFGETILATPISNYLDTNITSPQPRAFQIGEFFDTEYTFGKAHKRSSPENPHKVGIARPASPDSTNSFDFNDKSKLLNKKLIIHGGTNGEVILGDTWWFDLDDEVWSNVNTYLLEYDLDENSKATFKEEVFQCQVKNVGHQSLILDRYLILILGSIPANYSKDYNSGDKIPDISNLLSELAENSEDALYNRFFCLNLVTQTWVLVKMHHNLQITEPSIKNGPVLSNIGCTIVASNSKVLYTGGYVRNHLLENPELVGHCLLSGNLVVIEFPLGTSTNDAIRKV